MAELKEHTGIFYWSLTKQSPAAAIEAAKNWQVKAATDIANVASEFPHALYFRIT